MAEAKSDWTAGLVSPCNHETRLEELEARVQSLEEFVNAIAQGVEQAKQNPMIANLMKAMGLD